MIDVSVITPTFNRAPLLMRVWASLLKQNANFEWIVVDDGSTDNTREIITALNDSRIVYLALPYNQGVNTARNAGTRLARGRYIVFLDSDDELLPGSLERMIQIMDETEPHIGVAAFACIMADTGKWVSQLKHGQVLTEYDQGSVKVKNFTRPTNKGKFAWFSFSS